MKCSSMTDNDEEPFPCVNSNSRVRDEGESALESKQGILAPSEVWQFPSQTMEGLAAPKWRDAQKLMVGAARFELTTPCAQGRCATRLRYAPTLVALLILSHFPGFR